MNDQSLEVKFNLFSFSTENAIQLLLPNGSMVFQGLGFPKDFDDCTVMPTRAVSYWGTDDNSFLDAQWYKPISDITRSDIPEPLEGTTRVNEYLCHGLRPKRNVYPITSLFVGQTIVQSVEIINKKLVFSRLGNIVELDITDVPDNQRFTLTISWSYSHLEIRVTWVEGEGLDKYFSGEGVKYEELDSYVRPDVGEIIQFKAVQTFDGILLPSNIAKAIWSSAPDDVKDVAHTKAESLQGISAIRKDYKNKDDFIETLKNIFHQIQSQLNATKPYGFWNGDNPKSEPESGTTLRYMFESICSYKNIDVTQEIPSRSGLVDFVFSGISIDTTRLKVLLELKNAHSQDLIKGLASQLPQYIDEHSCEGGFYGVLWFKGEKKKFDEPKKYKSINDLLTDLKRSKPERVIEVIIFDLSFPLPASKL